MAGRRGWVLVLVLWSLTAADARREALLAPSAGQTPTDTASDGATVFAIENRAELGGPSLKVTFAPGDTFGDRIAKVSDWKPFSNLAFATFNPGAAPVKLMLVIKFERSTSFGTRIDTPVTLKPGRTDVSLPLAGLALNGGGAPDWGRINRWYLATEEGKAPLLWFSDIVLTSDESGPAAPPATGVTPAAPGIVPLLGAGAWRLRGKIGDQTVDLLLTPEPVAGAPAAVAAATPAKAGLNLDPARIERLRNTKMPPITHVVPYDTPEADAICSALEVYPPDNPWNQLITDWPTAPNSAAIVASVGNDKPLRYNDDMTFVLVPPDQPRIDVRIKDYGGESDKGPYPVPDLIPIEGWPAGFQRDPQLARLTLDDVQRDRINQNSDRHASVVDPVNRMLYEFYQMKKVGAGWQCAQASVFDLKSNALRPTGWTSTDAAGLPIFPAIVRYDELQRGVIDHALRFTVRHSRRAFVAPATHYASALTDENLPRMGERFRLRRDFDLSGFSPTARTILTALKRYGMLMADNGIEWGMSVSADPRVPVLHEEFRKVKGSDFEVVTAP
jgi:hypothetical protein